MILGAYWAYTDHTYLFVGFLLMYLVYRSILDYHKLKSQGIVSKKDVWKFIVPGHTITYFKELYFK